MREQLVARIENATAPFWRHVREALPSGIQFTAAWACCRMGVRDRACNDEVT